MIEVVLKGKYNTTFGTTLVIEPGPIINVGDIVRANGYDYKVEGFVCLSKAKPEDLISIVTKQLN